MSYYETPRKYASQRTIIHHSDPRDSRDSSITSRSSRDSRLSAGGYSSSSSSRSSMGYHDHSYSLEGGSDRKYRAPDDERKYIESKSRESSRWGHVEVVEHRKGRYVPDEPTPSQSSDHHPSKKHREHQHRSK